MSKLIEKLFRAFKSKEYAHGYVEEFLNANIATQIKVLREQKGWTQKELASITGMEQSRISLLENVNYDKWSISTLKKLAEAFDVTLNVSFENFTTKIREIENFSRESLERKSRMDDLTFQDQSDYKNIASINQLSLSNDLTTYSGLRIVPNDPLAEYDESHVRQRDKAVGSAIRVAV